MTDPRSGGHLRTAVAPAAGVAALQVAIWAASGAGYFWPMWPIAAMILILTLSAVVNATHRRTTGERDRRDLSFTGSFVVVWVFLVVIWAMSGAGYFWPVWPAIGLVAALFRHFARGRASQRQLAGRVDELTRTRAGAVDVQASELRRIERDLHDGAQSRLVALSMQIGRAEERLTSSGAAQADIELLRQARQEATAAITELRDLARGISPPVLADRGLSAAVHSLADRAGANVEVNADIDHRPPPAVENAAYFVIAESLTNAAKHAPGAPVRITIWHELGELGIVVADRGLGGADPDGGGLVGLRKRVEALDGWLEVSSAVGEGTTVRATLPCQ